ncbi:diguanylate cyclase domain-containing protein [Melaminivora sp.]|uniref:sensor domain-containing diguanylate cyclase n=1 Tax=Melaminivora sp. TaxID=1933032 RepID=UPI0028B1BB4E|nr:diguanylate cyclase [Melaminivora sp.]
MHRAEEGCSNVMTMERFFLSGPGSDAFISGHHDAALVVLSIAVAIATSALALHLAEQARRLPPGTARRHTALASGAAALGLGVWAMHFIGMLAWRLPVPVGYDLRLTMLSMLPSLAAAWVAFRLLVQRQVRRRQLLGSGALLGLGVGLMHYGGMAALRLEGGLRYDPLQFAVSVIVALVLATLALWLHFGLAGLGLAPARARLAAAVVMGLAISGMHYTAMGAARFTGPPALQAQAQVTWQHPLALALTLTLSIVGALLLVLNGLMRYRELFRQVHSNELRLRALVDTAVDAIITIDHHGIVQSANRSAERIFGWSEQDLVGRNVRMLMPEPFSSAHDGHLERYMATGQAHIIGIGREVIGLRRDGGTVPLRLAVGRFGPRRQPLFVGFLTDLTALKQAQAQLRIAASVFHHSYEAIAILDAQRRIVDLNPGFERMTGHPRDACLERGLEALYEGVDFAPIWQAVEQRGHWQGELTMDDAHGQTLAQRVSIAAVREGELPSSHSIAVITDITAAKAYEQKLERIALHDGLTGLPNRRLLADRLRQGIARAQRGQRLLAVCYLDLDGFKQVNDRHGHDAGDLLLVEMGRRIQGLLRAQDTLARLGGDEMALLLGDLDSPRDCRPVLERVLQLVNEPVALDSGTARVSASIGVSIYPLDADTPDLLLRRADQAMYQAKQAGKNQCQRYGAEAQEPTGMI